MSESKLPIRRNQKITLSVVNLLDLGYSYKYVSEALGVSVSIVNCVLSAYNAGFLTIKDYEESLASEKKYDNHNQYLRVREVISKKFPGSKEMALDPRDIESLSEEDGVRPKDYVSKMDPSLNSELKELLDELNDRERQIIDDFYFKGMTLKDVGTSLGVSKQSVFAIRLEAIEKMKAIHEGRECGWESVHFKPGEKCLASILSRVDHSSGWTTKDSLDLVNRLFHDGVRVRKTTAQLRFKYFSGSIKKYVFSNKQQYD